MGKRAGRVGMMQGAQDAERVLRAERVGMVQGGQGAKKGDSAW